MSDENRGAHRKYDVRRLDDPRGKHRYCSFWVLDLKHDEFARPALTAYADACAARFPELAADLRRIVEAEEPSFALTDAMEETGNE